MYHHHFNYISIRDEIFDVGPLTNLTIVSFIVPWFSTVESSHRKKSNVDGVLQREVPLYRPRLYYETESSRVVLCPSSLSLFL